MNKDFSNFGKILEKLKFKHAISKEAKDLALNYKIEALTGVLKNFGEYSTFWKLVLKVYFSAKKIGISLSVLQCKIILSVILAGSLSGVSAGVVKIAGKALLKEEDIPIKEEQKVQKIPLEKKDIPKKIYKAKKGYPVLRYWLIIEELQSNVIRKKNLKNFTGFIKNRIIFGAKKKKKVAIISKKHRVTFSLLLRGSIEKLGNNYIIQIKVIDNKTSKVVFVESKEVDHKDKIKGGLSEIIQKLIKIDK